MLKHESDEDNNSCWVVQVSLLYNNSFPSNYRKKPRSTYLIRWSARVDKRDTDSPPPPHTKIKGRLENMHSRKQERSSKFENFVMGIRNNAPWTFNCTLYIILHYIASHYCIILHCNATRSIVNWLMNTIQIKSWDSQISCIWCCHLATVH